MSRSKEPLVATVFKVEDDGKTNSISIMNLVLHLVAKQIVAVYDVVTRHFALMKDHIFKENQSVPH